MQRFKNILIYAGTEDNGAAMHRAIRLSQENAARLTLIDVIKPIQPVLGLGSEVVDSGDVQRLVISEHCGHLSRLVSQYAEPGIDIQTVVRVGDPAVEIVRQVIQHRHDLVIKTADGLSSVGRLFGSVARSLMRLCPCPVWVLKPEIHGEFDRVLAAVDVDTDDARHRALNRHLVSLAASIAAREQAGLHVVCGWDLWMESSLRRHARDKEVNMLIQARKQRISEAMDCLLDESDIDAAEVTVHLNRGSPTQVIPLTVDKIEADLLVMGTVCRTGVAGFLIGSTAESILTDLTCSVVTLKPDGFRSPVELRDPAEDADSWQVPPSLV